MGREKKKLTRSRRVSRLDEQADVVDILDGGRALVAQPARTAPCALQALTFNAAAQAQRRQCAHENTCVRVCACSGLRALQARAHAVCGACVCPPATRAQL
eukprot:4124248-Pleurochrysis_carterae.AAC.1